MSDIALVHDFMTSSVVTLTPDMSVGQAARALVRRGYSGAPVVDESRRLVGVFSETDALDTLASAAFYSLPEESVGDRMSAEVVSISPDADLYAATQKLRETGLKRLPVVDGDGRLVGLVTRRDVMKALASHSGEDPSQHRVTTLEILQRLRGLADPTR